MTAKDDAPLDWDRGHGAAAEERRAAVARAIAERIKAGDAEGVRRVLDDWAPADVLAMMRRLRFKRARRLLDWLPDETQFAVLYELDPRLREVVLEEETTAWLSKMLRRLDRDKAIRLLAGLPREVADELIAEMDAPERWRAELSWLEESAGATMHRGYVAVHPERRIGEVIEEIRARADRIEALDAIYVTDAEDRLLGYLRIRDLLLADREARVADVLRPDVVSVDADMDREAVLRLATERRLRVVAVRDRAGRLVGCVSARELAEIARAEAEEDMRLMAGLPAEASAHDRPLGIVRRRLPWLLGGLVGSTVAASVIGAFEDALAQAAILASFIPVVMATAGNAGIQASTVTVQALTAGRLWTGELRSRVAHETAGAALNGAVMGAAVALIVVLAGAVIGIDRPGLLALTAGLALFAVTTLASLMGTLAPLVLDRLKLDPAVATGIFITTGNDVFGVLIFFLIASALYL